MDSEIEIHGRIFERHPDISAQNIASAWANRMASGFRDDPRADQIAAIGFDENGRMIEMVATLLDNGTYLIFHAMSPPTKKMLNELRLI